MPAHKITAENYAFLDSPERQLLLPVGAVLITMQPLAGKTIVDFGAGNGYFTIPFSDAVGNQGKVYAVDSNQQMLDNLQKKAADRKNIITTLSTETAIPLPDGEADVILASSVLHELADRSATLNELVRISKPSSRLVVIEWTKYSGEIGPPKDQRIPPGQLTRDILALGYRVIRRFKPSLNYYGMVFSRGF